jgi:NO-binding membrane sensor protein with MHYT domain
VLFWLVVGAIAMGLGIGAMCCIGMLAFSMTMAVLYDSPRLVLPLLGAIVASLAHRQLLDHGCAAENNGQHC